MRDTRSARSFRARSLKRRQAPIEAYDGEIILDDVTVTASVRYSVFASTDGEVAYLLGSAFGQTVDADGETPDALTEAVTNLNGALDAAKAALEATEVANKAALEAALAEAETTLTEAINTVQTNLDNAKAELDKVIADGDKANADELILSGVCTLTDIPATRDEVFTDIRDALCKNGITDTGFAYDVANKARKGYYSEHGMDGYTHKMLHDLGFDDWYVDFLLSVRHLAPKALAVTELKYRILIASYCLAYPEEYREKEKTLKI